jgi:hypothetical protein
LWITALKLWITCANCGEVAQLFGFIPPYLADIPASLQNLDGAKKQSSGLQKASSIPPVFSTGCGKYSSPGYPALDARLPIRSQVGAIGSYPLIHRLYYHYYYSYSLKYMWRKE